MADFDQEDDEVLLRHIQTGPRSDVQAAFGALYLRYREALTASLAGDRLSTPEKEDILSEAWLRALQGIRSFQYRGVTLLPWLRVIARNAKLEYLRDRYHLAAYLDESVALDEPGDLPDGVIADVSRAEVREVIRRALQDAPEDYATIIEAAFFAELDTLEIMEMYQWSRAKVYTTKNRAIEWLRRHLPDMMKDHVVDTHP